MEVPNAGRVLFLMRCQGNCFWVRQKSLTATKIMEAEGNECLHEGWREENENTVRALSPCGTASPRGMVNSSFVGILSLQFDFEHDTGLKALTKPAP